MFVMYEKDAMRLPVKVWLEDKKDLEETCREQAYHLAQLPFLHKWEVGGQAVLGRQA